MVSGKSDIREELEARMTEIQREIGTLQEERNIINEKLQDAEARLSALRRVYEIEAERVGEPKIPLFARKGAVNRFAGMKLIDALSIVRREHPNIDKRKAAKVLDREGYDFRGKRQVTAVHYAWIALERREKQRA
jgi:hypothetical protein